MEHFVTLFDRYFLPQGVALHRSLRRVMPEAVLWVLCMDDQTHEVLGRLNLEGVRLLQLSRLETEELLVAKANRSNREYCWTMTPFASGFVFDADPSVARVTYLDADLWFRRAPRALFAELETSGKSVLITDHGYAPEHDQSATSGQYCVQFLCFVRDGGERVRRDWADKCLDWCYARIEDGRFGDQKYLDAWPQDFGDLVHVLEDRELTLAPWNATRFPYGRAVFYHFHGLRIRADMTVDPTSYALPQVVFDHVYAPYVADLKLSVAALRAVGWTVLPQATVPKPKLRHRLKALISKKKREPMSVL